MSGITQSISSLDPMPDIADPSTFEDRMNDALTERLPRMRVEMNTWAGQANALAAAMNAIAFANGLSLDFVFSSSTVAGDPGAGGLRCNNASQSASTALYIDLLTSDGADCAAAVESFDDSTSTVKGYLVMRHATDESKYLVLAVTGTVTTPTGYRAVPVIVVASSSANPFTAADPISLRFAPTGDKGDQGEPGAVSPGDLQDLAYVAFASAGSPSAFTIAPDPAIGAYAKNQSFFVEFHAAPAANATLAINGLASPPALVKVMSDGSYANVAANDWAAGHRSRVILLSPAQAWVQTVPSQSLAVGSIDFFPSLYPPPGYLKANGALLSRTSYAALWAFAQASGLLAVSDGAWTSGQFSPGNGTTTFRIPDARGYHLRAFDDARGVDSGRAAGSTQADQVISHGHTATVTDPGHYHGVDTAVGGGFIGLINLNGGGAGVQNSQGAYTGISVAISSTGGSENRVKNLAWLACIKY